MFLSEKVTYRVMRACIGIAMGMAIWLMYIGYLVLSNEPNMQSPSSSAQVVLTPVLSEQK
jgi:hypothetical protein